MKQIHLLSTIYASINKADNVVKRFVTFKIVLINTFITLDEG